MFEAQEVNLKDSKSEPPLKTRRGSKRLKMTGGDEESRVSKSWYQKKVTFPSRNKFLQYEGKTYKIEKNILLLLKTNYKHLYQSMSLTVVVSAYNKSCNIYKSNIDLIMK